MERPPVGLSERRRRGRNGQADHRPVPRAARLPNPPAVHVEAPAGDGMTLTAEVEVTGPLLLNPQQTMWANIQKFYELLASEMADEARTGFLRGAGDRALVRSTGGRV